MSLTISDDLGAVPLPTMSNFPSFGGETKIPPPAPPPPERCPGGTFTYNAGAARWECMKPKGEPGFWDRFTSVLTDIRKGKESAAEQETRRLEAQARIAEASMGARPAGMSTNTKLLIAGGVGVVALLGFMMLRSRPGAGPGMGV